jgi:hypothetical protein
MSDDRGARARRAAGWFSAGQVPAPSPLHRVPPVLACSICYLQPSCNCELVLVLLPAAACCRPPVCCYFVRHLPLALRRLLAGVL